MTTEMKKKDYHYVLNVVIEASTEKEADDKLKLLSTPKGLHITDVNVMDDEEEEWNT